MPSRTIFCDICSGATCCKFLNGFQKLATKLREVDQCNITLVDFCRNPNQNP